MTSQRVQDLFAQTLLANYEDDAPWDAVFELQKNGDREVFEIASIWLQEVEPLKRARGAAVLAQLRSPSETPTNEPRWLFREEAFSLIANMLKSEDDALVIANGVSALGHLYNPVAIPIIASYTSSPDHGIRFSVACALGNFPNDAKAIASLLVLTRDDDSDVRDWAVFGIGVQGDVDSPEIRDMLFARVNDADEDTREEALVGLGKRRDPRVLPVLRNLLDSPVLKLRVAEAAAAMLGLATDPENWVSENYQRALDDAFGPPST